jgi:hypothetical protein
MPQRDTLESAAAKTNPLICRNIGGLQLAGSATTVCLLSCAYLSIIIAVHAHDSHDSPKAKVIFKVLDFSLCFCIGDLYSQDACVSLSSQCRNPCRLPLAKLVHDDGEPSPMERLTIFGFLVSSTSFNFCTSKKTSRLGVLDLGMRFDISALLSLVRFSLLDSCSLSLVLDTVFDQFIVTTITPPSLRLGFCWLGDTLRLL